MKDEIEKLGGRVDEVEKRVGAIERALAWVTGGAAGMAALAMAIKSGLLHWLADAK